MHNVSMSIIVGRFQSNGESLLANYTTLSREVVLTEFLERLISTLTTEDLTVFEETEEITYRQIHKINIIKIIDLLETALYDTTEQLTKTKGESKRKELSEHIEDISKLGILINRYLTALIADSEKHIKLLIV